MGKEFLELGSYYIVYYCPVDTHIEMNGEYAWVYLNTYVLMGFHQLGSSGISYVMDKGPSSKSQ